MDPHALLAQSRSATRTRVVGPHFLDLAEIVLSSLVRQHCPGVDTRYTSPFASTTGSKARCNLGLCSLELTQGCLGRILLLLQEGCKSDKKGYVPPSRLEEALVEHLKGHQKVLHS